MKALIILTVLSVATGFARLPLVRLRAVNFCEPLASQQRCPVVRAANNDDDEEDEDDEWARRDAWEASLRRPTGSRKPTEPSRQPRPEPEPEPDDDDADDDDEGRQISSEEVAAFRAALWQTPKAPLSGKLHICDVMTFVPRCRTADSRLYAPRVSGHCCSEGQPRVCSSPPSKSAPLPVT